MQLDILDLFNLIDRLEGLLTGLRYGDMGRTVRLDGRAGWTGAQAEELLRRYGVVVYGRRITSREIIFQVKNRQARWAEHVLLRAGAPVVSGEIDASNRGAQERHHGTLPTPWRDRRPR